MDLFAPIDYTNTLRYCAFCKEKTIRINATNVYDTFRYRNTDHMYNYIHSDCLKIEIHYLGQESYGGKYKCARCNEYKSIGWFSELEMDGNRYIFCLDCEGIRGFEKEEVEKKRLEKEELEKEEADRATKKAKIERSKKPKIKLYDDRTSM